MPEKDEKLRCLRSLKGASKPTQTPKKRSGRKVQVRTPVEEAIANVEKWIDGSLTNARERLMVSSVIVKILCIYSPDNPFKKLEITGGVLRQIFKTIGDADSVMKNKKDKVFYEKLVKRLVKYEILSRLLVDQEDYVVLLSLFIKMVLVASTSSELSFATMLLLEDMVEQVSKDIPLKLGKSNSVSPEDTEKLIAPLIKYINASPNTTRLCEVLIQRSGNTFQDALVTHIKTKLLDTKKIKGKDAAHRAVDIFLRLYRIIPSNMVFVGTSYADFIKSKNEEVALEGARLIVGMFASSIARVASEPSSPTQNTTMVSATQKLGVGVPGFKGETDEISDTTSEKSDAETEPLEESGEEEKEEKNRRRKGAGKQGKTNRQSNTTRQSDTKTTTTTKSPDQGPSIAIPQQATVSNAIGVDIYQIFPTLESELESFFESKHKTVRLALVKGCEVMLSTMSQDILSIRSNSDSSSMKSLSTATQRRTNIIEACCRRLLDVEPDVRKAAISRLSHVGMRLCGRLRLLKRKLDTDGVGQRQERKTNDEEMVATDTDTTDGTLENQSEVSERGETLEGTEGHEDEHKVSPRKRRVLEVTDRVVHSLYRHLMTQALPEMAKRLLDKMFDVRKTSLIELTGLMRVNATRSAMAAYEDISWLAPRLMEGAMIDTWIGPYLVFDRLFLDKATTAPVTSFEAARDFFRSLDREQVKTTTTFTMMSSRIKTAMEMYCSSRKTRSLKEVDSGNRANKGLLVFVECGKALGVPRGIMDQLLTLVTDKQFGIPALREATEPAGTVTAVRRVAAELNKAIAKVNQIFDKKKEKEKEVKLSDGIHFTPSRICDQEIVALYLLRMTGFPFTPDFVTHTLHKAAAAIMESERPSGSQTERMKLANSAAADLGLLNAAAAGDAELLPENVYEEEAAALVDDIYKLSLSEMFTSGDASTNSSSSSNRFATALTAASAAYLKLMSRAPVPLLTDDSEEEGRRLFGDRQTVENLVKLCTCESPALAKFAAQLVVKLDKAASVTEKAIGECVGVLERYYRTKETVSVDAHDEINKQGERKGDKRDANDHEQTPLNGSAEDRANTDSDSDSDSAETSDQKGEEEELEPTVVSSITSLSCFVKTSSFTRFSNQAVSLLKDVLVSPSSSSVAFKYAVKTLISFSLYQIDHMDSRTDALGAATVTYELIMKQLKEMERKSEGSMIGVSSISSKAYVCFKSLCTLIGDSCLERCVGVDAVSVMASLLINTTVDKIYYKMLKLLSIQIIGKSAPPKYIGLLAIAQKGTRGIPQLNRTCLANAARRWRAVMMAQQKAPSDKGKGEKGNDADGGFERETTPELDTVDYSSLSPEYGMYSLVIAYTGMPWNIRNLMEATSTAPKQAKSPQLTTGNNNVKHTPVPPTPSSPQRLVQLDETNRTLLNSLVTSVATLLTISDTERSQRFIKQEVQRCRILKANTSRAFNLPDTFKPTKQVVSPFSSRGRKLHDGVYKWMSVVDVIQYHVALYVKQNSNMPSTPGKEGTGTGTGVMSTPKEGGLGVTPMVTPGIPPSGTSPGVNVSSVPFPKSFFIVAEDELELRRAWKINHELCRLSIKREPKGTMANSSTVAAGNNNDNNNLGEMNMVSNIPPPSASLKTRQSPGAGSRNPRRRTPATERLIDPSEDIDDDFTFGSVKHRNKRSPEAVSAVTPRATARRSASIKAMEMLRVDAEEDEEETSSFSE